MKLVREGKRYFSTSLNTTLTTLDPTVIDSITPLPRATSLGDPPTLGEIEGALRDMTEAKAMGPDGLTAEDPELGVGEKPSGILHDRGAFGDIVSLPQHHRRCLDVC